MKKRDVYFLWSVFLLLAAGLLALASASAGLSENKYGTPYYFLTRQLLFGVGGGLILFLIALRIPISFYKTYAPHLLIGSIFLLLVVFIPTLGGTTIKGAARWIQLGPLSFQPSELLKLTLVMYLAAWMTAKKKEISSFSLGLIPFLVIVGIVSVFLIKEPDIGTLGVIALTSLGLFFVGGGRPGQIFFAVFLGVFFLFILIQFAGYRQDRLTVFINTWVGKEVNTQNEGYQYNQALIAIGSGGFFGKGLGLSMQKFLYLPEPAGDAVFAIFAEEFGFFGSSILFFLFLAFFIRGMLIAGHEKDHFAQLFACGIMLLVMVQVIVNIGALTGLLPLTGIPLPFVSYGGSALALLLFEMGIMVRISKHGAS